MTRPPIMALLLLLAALLQLSPPALAAGPVYVVLWFDTEDYVEPAADDAALRIATDLTSLGVRATFKVVGEKARVLESRGRTDVIRALSAHAIGYHSNWHSLHPTPAEYLQKLGYVEGVAEFQRREGPGAADVQRIFKVAPVAYGQPGSSWAPQSNPALRQMHIPIYLDEGEQVGLREQPFWYNGLLHVFNMGRNQVRAPLDGNEDPQAAYAHFDQAAAQLRNAQGGLISIYYHPTEFIATEFWDAVNFAKGATPDRPDWKKPHRRTPADSERCYRLLKAYVEHMKQVPGTRFVAGSDLLALYGSPLSPRLDSAQIASHLSHGITFLEKEGASYSPADMLLQLLGLEPQVVDGPTARASTTYRASTVSRPLWQRSVADAVDFIRSNHRLPNQVFLGSQALSLEDFTATLAAAPPGAGPIPIRQGKIEFEKYFSNEPEKSFSWPIHPAGFSAPELLELARLQGWTLKPAILQPPPKR